MLWRRLDGIVCSVVITIFIILVILFIILKPRKFCNKGDYMLIDRPLIYVCI